MTNMYGLRKVQETNLKILKEIDRICTKYRISYSLDAGTLLGAIRHGGFIPWDDDADLVMPRNSWEAFRKVAPRELPEGMKLLLPDSFAGGTRFYDFTPRIIYLKSRRRIPDRETAFYEEKLNHLWVDLFILDRLPDSRGAASGRIARQKAVYAAAMGHRWGINLAKYPGMLKAAVAVSTAVGRGIPMRSLFRLQDALAKADNNKKTAYWYYSNYDPGFIDIRLKDSWVTEQTRILFEDVELCIPVHYDEVLRHIYGDYMQLPPKEKRVPSHESTGIEIYE